MSLDAPEPEIDSEFLSRGSLGLVISLGFAAWLVMIVVSVLPPGALLLLMVMGVTLPVVLTTVMIWGRVRWRPFAIGAMVPAVLVFCATVSCFVYLTFEGPSDWDDIEGAGLGLLTGLLSSVGCGMLGFYAARYFERDDVASSSDGRLQFSIRAMLGLTTAIAIGLTLFFVVPPELGTICLLLIGLALTVVLVNGMVYGSSWWRTFSLGAIFPMALFYAVIVSYFVIAVFDGDWLDMGRDFDPGIRIAAFLTMVVGFGCGMLAVRTRAWLR